MKLSHLSTAIAALCLALFQGDEERFVPYVVHTPTPWPDLVAIPDAGEDTARYTPTPAALERNGALSDRFARAGQSVRYSFEARAGEASVFEIECYGFSRGWAATVAVRVLDASDEVLVEQSRDGGATFGLLVPFTAPSEGTYTLELTARAQFVRYLVVRHSDLCRSEPGASLHLADATEAFGHLTGRGDQVGYALSAAPGERVSVTVLPLRAPHRDVVLAQRAAVVESVATARRVEGAIAPDRLLAEAGPRSDARNESRGRGAAVETPWPGLIVPVEDAHPGPAVQRLELVADEHGVVRFAVVQRAGAIGGLYQLAIERSFARSRVKGRIGDKDDEPMSGVEVRFLLEPTYDVIARATSGADGTFEIDAPVGEYSILLFGGGSPRVERVRTRIAADQELNLVRSTN